MTYHAFHATDVTHIGEPELDETERLQWFPSDAVRKLLRTGQIADGPSLTVISYYLAIRD